MSVEVELNGAETSAVEEALRRAEREQVVRRLWEGDHTLWKPSPAEISNRLGWLTIMERSRQALPELGAFADELRAEGYRLVLLVGMGGSSLAPEVFARTFGPRRGYLALRVLDSTDPGVVLAGAEGGDPSRTLVLVSTKSGGTVETASLLRYFYNRMVDALGPEEGGRHLAAITDPGSSLADLAKQLGFRRCFLNDPNIGGRYSALSLFGLVPAALLGVDLERVLQRAEQCARQCGPAVPVSENPAARLGVALGACALAGRDKLTFLTARGLESFGDWAEQLIAESTGKEGKGILPVVGEKPGAPAEYGTDRLFAWLGLGRDARGGPRALRALQRAGHPVLRLFLADRYDLGAQFFLWEMATAIAGWCLGINPFDQPDVESAKVRAREMVAAYAASGRLPEDPPAALGPQALSEFLGLARPGGYIAIQAYLQPNRETQAALGRLRRRLRERTGLAVTVGYGPRFLHSTGQLHKGDGGRGLFIQITAPSPHDVPIPDAPGRADSSIRFGTLKLAQALGDKRALEDKGRPVIRFDLGAEGLTALRRLT